MVFNYDIIEIFNKNKIKLKKGKNTHKELKFPLREIYKKALHFIRKDKNNYLIARMTTPFFWISIKNIDFNGNKIVIDKNNIKINDNVYNNFIDYEKVILEKNLPKINYSLSSHQSIMYQYYVKYLFYEVKYEKKRENINVLMHRNTPGLDITEYTIFTHALNVKNMDIDFLIFNDSLNKTTFQIKPSIIYSNFSNLNKINRINSHKAISKPKKYDFIYSLLRKYNVNGMILKESDYIYRLKNTVNYLLKRTKKNGSIILFYNGGFREDFYNTIIALTNYFKKIYLKKIPLEDTIGGHFWIVLKKFKSNIELIDFTKNYYSNIHEALNIKKKIYNFVNNNMINIINIYEEIQNNIDMLNIDNVKNKIIYFMEKNNIPINILQNNMLVETNRCNYNDMRLFLNFIFTNKISIVNEIGIKFNNFIYIVYLYNIQYKGYKNKIKYNLINPILDINEYVDIYKTDFELSYNKKILKNSLTIINSPITDAKKYRTKYIIFYKNQNQNQNIDILPFIRYKIINETENYYFLEDS